MLRLCRTPIINQREPRWGCLKRTQITQMARIFTDNKYMEFDIHLIINNIKSLRITNSEGLNIRIHNSIVSYFFLLFFALQMLILTTAELQIRQDGVPKCLFQTMFHYFCNVCNLLYFAISTVETLSADINSCIALKVSDVWA